MVDALPSRPSASSVITPSLPLISLDSTCSAIGSFEGVSFLFTEYDDNGDICPAAVVDEIPKTYDQHKSVIIRTIVPGFPSKRPPLPEPDSHGAASEGDAKNYVDIQIPLATTIFHTGLESTMKCYDIKGEDGSLHFDPAEEDFVERYHIKWPALESGRTATDLLRFNLPLVPLTQQRRIDSVFGNIIRSLYLEQTGSHAQEEPSPRSIIPATQELEYAINSLPVRAHYKTESIKIWALIIPKSVTLEQLKTSPHLSSHDSRNKSSSDDVFQPFDLSDESFVARAILQGSGLYRVTGGGGGWGHRAGILSLEPETNFDNRPAQQPTGSDWEFTEYDALASVATTGDYLQYYIHKNESYETTLSTGASSQDFCFSVCFGTTQFLDELSTESINGESDSVEFNPVPPSGLKSHPEAPAQPRKAVPDIFVYHENHFGALSENGVAFILSNTRESAGNVGAEGTSSTRITVPGSYVTIIRTEH